MENVPIVATLIAIAAVVAFIGAAEVGKKRAAVQSMVACQTMCGGETTVERWTPEECICWSPAP